MKQEPAVRIFRRPVFFVLRRYIGYAGLANDMEFDIVNVR